MTTNRKRIIYEIINITRDCCVKDLIVDKENLIAQICLRYNLSRRTVLEYFNLLNLNGNIKINKNEIEFIKDLNE